MAIGVPDYTFLNVMQQPSYFLQPPFGASAPEVVDSFESLFAEQILGADGTLIEYTLPAPKWQFLNYLGDTKDIVMHGGGVSAISEFQPRQSDDAKEFAQLRAYGTARVRFMVGHRLRRSSRPHRCL